MAGFLARLSGGLMRPRTLQAGTGIAITNPSGDAGDPVISATGGGGGGPFVGCSVYKNAITSAPNGYSVVNFEAETFDYGSLHSVVSNQSRFTAPVSGVYVVAATLLFMTIDYASVAYGCGLLGFSVRKNGSIFPPGGGFFTPIGAGAAGGSNQSVVSSVTVDLVAGDYIEIMAYQTNALDPTKALRVYGDTAPSAYNSGVQFYKADQTGATGAQGDPGPAGGILQDQWNWIAAATSTTIAAGKAAANNDNVTLATQFLVHKLAGSSAGTDWSTVISSMVTGDKIYFQRKTDATIYNRYTLTGAPVLTGGTTWFIPVTWTSGTGEPANGIDIIVAFQRLTDLPSHHTTHETGGTDAIAHLSGAVIDTGTVPDFVLSANVIKKNVANVFTSNQRISRLQPAWEVLMTGGVAVGRFAQWSVGARLDMWANASYDGSNVNSDDTSKPSTLYSQIDGNHYFQVAPAGANPRTAAVVNQLAFDAAGVVQLYQGQIQFPAAQNAHAGANVLDDYEEGSFTPVDASGAGLAFTSVQGLYVKVGRFVFFKCGFQYPATSNTANAMFGGLPFVPATGIPGGSAKDAYPCIGGTPLYLYVREGVARVEIFKGDGSYVLNNLCANALFYVSGTYLAAS